MFLECFQVLLMYVAKHELVQLVPNLEIITVLTSPFQKSQHM